MTAASNVDPVSILKPNIVLLKLLGFWEDHEGSSVYKQMWYRLYRSLVIFSQVLFFFTGLWYIYDEREAFSLKDINLVLYVYATVPLNVIMAIISYSNIDIIHLIQAMKSRRYQPRSPTQHAFVRGWKRVARRCQTFFISVNAFLLVAVTLLALYNGENTLFVAHVPSFFNWQVFFAPHTFRRQTYFTFKHHHSFSASVFFGGQVLMSLYTSQMAANYASMLAAFLIELVIQIYLIKNALEQMCDRDEFIQCVKCHLYLLLLRKKIQRFCSIGVSLVFLTTVIIICTTTSLITQEINADVAFLFPYLSEIVLIILVNCWCGSEVTSQSDGISYSIFSSDWTGSDISYMRLIKMHLLLTERPMEIYLGGGISTMSLPVFVMIMKTNYTVFTILQRFQD